MIDRRLFHLLCVLLVSSACGKRGGGGGGATVGSGSAVLTLATGQEAPAGLGVTVKLASEVPERAKRYSMTLGAHYTQVSVIEVTPPAVKLAAPARLAMKIDPARIAKGHAVESVTGLEILADGTLLDLGVRVVGPELLDVTIEHGGTVMLLAPIEDVSVVGRASQVVGGASELLMRGDCTSWITPDSPRVAALAKDPAGLVIDKDHAIHLGAKLAPSAPGDKLLHADELLAQGTADPGEASVVLASILSAQGHAVRLASGLTAYVDAGIHYKGVAQWAEVIFDGKPWFVDARDVANPKLVPLAEANKQLSLVVGRGCPKYPPGTSTDAAMWLVPAPE